jgi:hypothetical protein
MSGDDFVGIVGQLTNFIENERTGAYNEGVDMILGNAKAWMREEGISPKSDNIPSLLDEIKAYFQERSPPHAP